MGLFDSIGNFISDTADAVGDVASDIGGAIAEGLESAAGAAGDVGGFVGDAIAGVATAVDTATFGLAGRGLNFLDDTVFDTVDYVTGGLVDVDFDDGKFGAKVGIEGVASVGAGLGDHGVDFSTGTVAGGFGTSLTDDGFSLSGSAGIDFGPLPYANGHVELSADGSVTVGGHAQGVIPTPIGIVSGEVDGGFSRTPDGAWAGNVSADGMLTLPSGTYVGGRLDLAHTQTADGDSITTVGVGGRLGEHGVGEVSVGVDYTHAEVDGVTIDQVQGSAQASGYGFQAGVEGGYQRVESGDDVIETAGIRGQVTGFGESISGEADYAGGRVGGQDFGGWTGSVSTTLDADRLVEIGRSVLGEQAEAAELPGSADELVGMLGSGGTAGLIGQLGGSELDAFVGSLGGDAAQNFVGKLVADGNFGSLLGADTTAVQHLIGKVAEQGGLEDLLGQLDPGTTANLVSTLTQAAADVDVLGVDTAVTAPTDAITLEATTTVATPDALVTNDVTMSAEITGDALTGDVMAVDAHVGTTVVDAPEPTAPATTFDQQIQAAEQAEQDIDEMFDGLA